MTNRQQTDPLDHGERRAPAGRESGHHARTTAASGKPPWVGIQVPRDGGASPYETLPGGWDEPPTVQCRACGMIGGHHRPDCGVEAWEHERYSRWEDACLEAGDTRLWADVIANAPEERRADAPAASPATRVAATAVDGEVRP